MSLKGVIPVFLLIASTVAPRARADEINDLIDKANEAIEVEDGDLVIALANRILRLAPNLGDAYNIRAEGYSFKGDYQQAIADSNEALTFDLTAETKSFAYDNRGWANFMLGNHEKAKSDIEQALRLHSKNDVSLACMARILATCPEEKFRDGKKAWEFAKKAYELKTDSYFQDTLAAAYAECGDFDEAIRWQKKAMESAQGERSGTEKKKKELKDRLQLYEQHKPFRETLKK
jgi:tetratricopeptide (TPR) repeat protein